MIKKRGAEFLEVFFQAGGNHPNPVEAMEHFHNAFVRPPQFHNLIRELRPEQGRKKVVIVDGHPRSGKTFSVARAVAHLVDELDSPNQWWTSGADSLAVFPSNDDNLYDGALKVQSQLEEYSSLKLVLLDDFLGTNQPRDLGRTPYDLSVRPFFVWDEENPWLRCLSEGSTLIITARSLHLTLADLALDVKIRKGTNEVDVINVRNPRRGIFRTFEKGEHFGAFDEKNLRMVYAKNKKYHPLRTDLDWLIIAAPLLAFYKNEALSESQKEFAARILFSEDLEVIAEKVKQVENLKPDQAPADWRSRVLCQLYKTYLVAIAPGLLFLDKISYTSLGIDDEVRDIVVEGLYLNESIDEFCSGRLPNEFYMIAINEHLDKYIDLAASVFAHVVNYPGSPKMKADNIPGLGLRGLLERGLHKKEKGAMERLLAVRDFTELVDLYLKQEPNCLLHLEYCKEPLSRRCSVVLSPGLSSSMGWALCNFFVDQPDRIREAITEWFAPRFKVMLDNLKYYESEWRTDPKLAESDYKNTIPDYDSRWDVVPAYSTFLQWVIKIDQSPVTGGFLDQIIGLYNDYADGAKKELRIVLEDELLWAWGEGLLQLTQLPSVKSILSFLDPTERAQDGHDYDERVLLANRLFTLAWHNKWMEPSDRDLSAKAWGWLRHYSDKTLEYLEDQPALLDENLRYHWEHFITQRAAWMRDWCFQNDPTEFERSYSKVARGSDNPDHNELIFSIADKLISGRDFNERRIRNLFLLLGTRASRIQNIGVIAEKIDWMIERNGNRRESISNLLQAIFELGRQGFLDDWSENTTEPFRDWCKRKLHENKRYIEAAWDRYWDELDKVTLTHLDLLPRQEKGWNDVLPKSLRI
ncbi:MAG TPA: hypothetical protein VKA70_09275 [Blastocatellia bacterium]|nr:hypothetical protein [Blastocatellia bacterium]